MSLLRTSCGQRSPRPHRVLLSTNGYKPPSARPNVLDFYNPFDWDDELREGRIGKVPITKVLGVPLALMTSPFRYVVSPIARGAWETVNKALNFSFRVGRSMHTQYDPAAEAVLEPI